MDDLISRQAAIDAVLELIEARRRWDSDARGEIAGLDAAMCEINSLPSAQPHVPDTNVGDIISRQAAIEHIEAEYQAWGDEYDVRQILGDLEDLPSAQPDPLTLRVNRELTKEEYDKLMQDIKDAPIMLLPSAQTEWNNHTVACLLAELFDDTCACNYNDIDEWLPEKCELLDSCPNPGGVACWEQFLKHKAERRTDE